MHGQSQKLDPGVETGGGECFGRNFPLMVRNYLVMESSSIFRLEKIEKSANF